MLNKITQTSLENVFLKLTGFKPYPFQLQIAEELLSKNKNMVITAPTGSGKTWLACLPFVYAKLKGLPFADRMFYVLPQRTLVTAVGNTIRDKLKKLGINNINVQMGGQADDPFFEGDVIVTTIDQLLSTYIGLSYGSSPSSSNIAPGALLGSYVVIDEFHMLEVDKSLTTFLDLAERFKPFVQVLMMTATASHKYMQEIAKRIKGVSWPITPQEVVSLQGDKVRRREIYWQSTVLTADEILRKHKQHTLVVANTVRRVQELYEDLQKKLKGGQKEIKLICLHARFLPEDRNEKETFLKEMLQPKADQELIVIGNQVVEVGLDVSADVLLTELCPANSLVQRIGRCTRYGEGLGHVHVYELPLSQNGKVNTAPYSTNGMDELLQMTKEYLIRHAPLKVTAIEEEKMIQEIHGDKEYKELKAISKSRRRKAILGSLVSRDISKLSELIRDINNLQMIIHPSPEELDLYKKLNRFSIPLNTLEGFVSALKKEGINISEVIFYPEFPTEWKIGDQPKWHPFTNKDKLMLHSLIVVSPKVAQYSKEKGLVLNQEGNFVSKESSTELDRGYPSFSYKKETYVEHVMDVRKLVRQQDDRYQVFANQIANEINVKAETIHEWSEWVAALHDIGKLSVKYVQALHAWQRDIHGDQTTELLAHTTYNDQNPYHLQQIKEKKYERPNHAPEGSFAASPLFEVVIEQELRNQEDTIFNQIYQAMLFAIRRHHGAYVSNLTEPFKLIEDAEEVVKGSLSGFNVKEINLKKQANYLEIAAESNAKLDVSKRIELVLYWHFVRRLRLADQASQRNKVNNY